MVGVGCVTVIMVGIECLNAASVTLTKAAMIGGEMSNLVFLLYMNIIAALFLLPFSILLLYYRKSGRPSLTLPILFRVLVLGIVSFGMQISGIYGLKYTSPTQVSAITDLSPAFTFFFAVIFGMETLDLRIGSSRAKSLGTLISIAGALTITLYKGPPILGLSHSSSKLLHQHQHFFDSSQSNWILGCLFLAAACFFLSLLHIVQTWVIRVYPEELIVTFISCIFVVVQCAIVSLIFERDHPSAWILRPGAELTSILISAILLTAIQNSVHTWACRKKGPVYTTMFKPLKTVFAIIMGFVFLKDTIYVGSVVGAFVIVVGFYSVIWGQAKQQQEEVQGSSRTPLLPEENLDSRNSVQTDKIV